jgi:PKD repeat protein
MNRTTASQGLMLAVMALLAAGCTQTPEKPVAKATSTPAAAAAATPVAQAPAPAAAEADELYVDLEGDPDEGAPPLSVKWTSTVEDGTPPYTYKWDFGDGSPVSTDANPTHVYQKEGEFTATLSVSDSKGLTGSEEYDILVEKEEE